jgi:hypothetical protein
MEPQAHLLEHVQWKDVIVETLLNNNHVSATMINGTTKTLHHISSKITQGTAMASEHICAK